MKKSIFSLIVVIMLLVSVSVSAAPYSVDGIDGGNDASVLVVTNPLYSAVTVTSGELVVSGYCQSGATLNIYKLSPAGTYDITGCELQVGASGVFFQKLAVNPGRSSFVIRAEMPDGRYQQRRFDVLYFGGSFVDYIMTF